jgi:hypothetical protein
MKCNNCLIEQESEEGIIEFHDNLCEDCYERNEYVKILQEDSNRYLDFDYSMNQ